MTSCEFCMELGRRGSMGQKCCRTLEKEIKDFKYSALKHYIFEIIIDLLISSTSVVMDIVTLILYISRGKWTFALFTAVPVLLPTTIFTNVYLRDETKGYCKMPAKKKGQGKKLRGKKGPEQRVEGLTTKQRKSFDLGTLRDKKNGAPDLVEEGHLDKFHGTKSSKKSNRKKKIGGASSRFFSNNFISFANGNNKLSNFGIKTLRRTVQRSFKFFFGTFVLRFIACAWYFKALIFGVKAYKNPKKYIKLETPKMHWSYELLVRLDFLQAALENAPQVVIQMMALIVDPENENRTLAAFTLLFSFIDFLRVAINVHWDVHKGPVVAPTGCYGSLFWKMINALSWITVYGARSTAIAFSMSSIYEWTAVVPAFWLIVHISVSYYCFKSPKYGMAADKIFVTMFITIYFLPEFAGMSSMKMIQLYYALMIIENVFFIIPWNGIDTDLCIKKTIVRTANNTINPKTEIGPKVFTTVASVLTSPNLYHVTQHNNPYERIDQFRDKFESFKSDCAVDPTMIVLIVPTLTVFGAVLRLTSSEKMMDFKKCNPVKENGSLKMEERIASLYNRKWTTMTFKEMTQAFKRMLKKEVMYENEAEYNRKMSKKRTQKLEKRRGAISHVMTLSESVEGAPKRYSTFIRNSFSLFSSPVSTLPFKKYSLPEADGHLGFSSSKPDSNDICHNHLEERSSNASGEELPPEEIFENSVHQSLLDLSWQTDVGSHWI